MSKPKVAHVSDSKKKQVKQLVDLAKKYKVIGIVDMANLPSLQLQRMRGQLRGQAEVYMAKNRIIKVALDQIKDKVGDKLDEIKSTIRGMPAMIFTNEDSFKLYKKLAKSKSTAPAKAGQIAPKDIVVQAGATSFAPGPVIGELGSLGIKTEIKEGKIHIKENKVVLKEGDKITSKTAELLTRLGIEPMEVGLNILSTFEDGIVYTRKILEIDEAEYINNIKLLHSQALSVAMHIGYVNNDTVKLLLRKAHAEASALANSQDIITSDNVKLILAKADAQANSLKTKIGEK
ncbi:MAG: 50S ribosomal protein L10 [archaeon]